MPTKFNVGDDAVAFVTSPSQLNLGWNTLQHQFLRGLNVGQVGAGLFRTPVIGDGIAYTNLPGFSGTGAGVNTNTIRGVEAPGAFNGSAFGFFFENPNSVWIIDAGVNPNDRDVCNIQRWVRTTTDPSVSWFASSWAWAYSYNIDASSPCFTLAGRVEGTGLNLYTTTVDGGSAVFGFPTPGVGGGKRAASSQLYRLVISAAGAVASKTVVATAPPNTQFRGVTLPPYQRANLTCAANAYITTADLACVGSTCCVPCRTSCPAGMVLLNTCNSYGDNRCMLPAAYTSFKAATAAAATAAGVTAPPTVGVYTLWRSPSSRDLTPSAFTPSILTAIATAAAGALQIPSAAVTASVDATTATVYGSDLAAAGATRRELQGTAGGNIVGVRVLLTIIAAQAAASPVVRAAAAAGAPLAATSTDYGAIGAALRAAVATPAVATAIATRTVQATGVCAASPCVCACLGYATTAEAATKVAADPTRTAPVVTNPGAASGAASSAADSLSPGATAGVAIGVVIVVVCAAGVIYAMTDGCGMNGKSGAGKKRAVSGKDAVLTGAVAVSNPAAAGDEPDKTRFAVSPLAARA